MPFLPAGVGAAVAGGVASAGAGALISGLMSPGTSGASNGSSLYVPTGLSTADQQWQALQTGNYDTYNGNDLQQYGLDSLYGSLNANNAYGNGANVAGMAAGQQYSNLGNTLAQQSTQNYGTQQQLQGQAQGLMNAGNQVYQMGLDPNQAQYNLSLNNLQQQTGATNSMYGLGSSGAGAGVQNQALQNFGINWNTQQLANAATGLSAYDSAAGAANSLYGQAGQYGNLAGQQGAAAPAATLQGGMTPYTTAQTLAATPGQAGNTYGQYLNSNVYSPAQTIQGTGQNYMNSAEGVNATAFNAGNQAAGALGSAVTSGINGIGTTTQNAGGLANLFQGTTGSYGSGNLSPYYSGGGNSYGFTM